MTDALIRMRVDRAYKGVSEEMLSFQESDLCAGTSVEVGEQYVLHKEWDGVEALGCMRSANAKDDAEDLKFLNALADGPPTGTIFGEVTLRTGGIASEGAPASGAIVELQGVGAQRSSKTDSEGSYCFSGLDPGSYVVHAAKPGFHESQTESDVSPEVAPGASELVHLVVRHNASGAISGRLTRSDGTPAPAGITLDLIRMIGATENRKSELMFGFRAQTDEHGEYRFRDVLPGKYKVVVNLDELPTVDDPYPTIYWPAAKTAGDGWEIEIGRSTPSQECNFLLPPPLTSTPVGIVVLLPDGTPATGVSLNIVAGNSAIRGDLHTDATGRLTFGAAEGFDYIVGPIFTDTAMMASPVHLSAADAARPVIIKLVPRDQ